VTERQADQKWVEDTRAEYLRRAVSHSANEPIYVHIDTSAFRTAWLRFDAQTVAAGGPPEAIVPLHRNPDGNLGTRVMGGAPERK
jgi:hypothetical protein